MYTSWFYLWQESCYVRNDIVYNVCRKSTSYAYQYTRNVLLRCCCCSDMKSVYKCDFRSAPLSWSRYKAVVLPVQRCCTVGTTALYCRYNGLVLEWERNWCIIKSGDHKFRMETLKDLRECIQALCFRIECLWKLCRHSEIAGEIFLYSTFFCFW